MQPCRSLVSGVLGLAIASCAGTPPSSSTRPKASTPPVVKASATPGAAAPVPPVVLKADPTATQVLQGQVLVDPTYAVAHGAQRFDVAGQATLGMGGVRPGADGTLATPAGQVIATGGGNVVV